MNAASYEAALFWLRARGDSAEESFRKDRSGLVVAWKLRIERPLGNGIGNIVEVEVPFEHFALAKAAGGLPDLKFEALRQAWGKLDASIVQTYDDYEVLKAVGIKP